MGEIKKKIGEMIKKKKLKKKNRRDVIFDMVVKARQNYSILNVVACVTLAVRLKSLGKNLQGTGKIILF